MSIFNPKKPDTSKQEAALDRQEASAKAREEEQNRELAGRRKSLRRGRRSLLSGSETGEETTAPLKETLG